MLEDNGSLVTQTGMDSNHNIYWWIYWIFSLFYHSYNIFYQSPKIHPHPILSSYYQNPPFLEILKQPFEISEEQAFSDSGSLAYFVLVSCSHKL